MERGPIGHGDGRTGLKTTLVDRARDLFTEIASRHQLAIEWDVKAPVELACWLRKQRGLDWDLWLNLQNNDELGVQHDVFTAKWFPGHDARKEAKFVTVVDGLISGDVRIKCFSRNPGKKPYRVDLEELSANEWRRAFTYRCGFSVRFPASIQVLRNGYVTAGSP
jgi:hypothetical protein